MAVKRRQAFQPIPKSVRKKHAWKTLPEYILDIYKTDKKVLPDQFTEASYSVSAVGFDKIEKRITFPIRDYLGELIGVSGRATKDWQTPRYKVYTYPSVPNYYPENRKHLYLLDQVYPKQFFNQDYQEPTVIVEGYKAALWVQQNGFNAVAVQGSQITSSQLVLLTKLRGEKIILLDNEAGKHMQTDKGSEAEKMFHKLLQWRNCTSIAVYPDNKVGQAPDDLTPEELTWAIENRAHTLILNKWKRK